MVCKCLSCTTHEIKEEPTMELPSETEIRQLCARMGVSREAFAASARRAATGEYKPFAKPIPLPDWEGRAGDDGFPPSSDQSARAHVHRAKNHLESALTDGEGDEIDMSRLTSARACIDKAIACRGGGGQSAHRVLFPKRNI
jgi:hypothetical protein